MTEEPDDDLVGTYEQTARRIGGAVAAVRPGQLHDPTPCTEWDVEALLDHIVATVRAYTMIAEDGAIDYDRMHVPDLATRYASAYDEAVDAALTAWRRPGVLDEPCRHRLGPMSRRDALAFHHADLLVHGWDLSVATGRDDTIDDHAAATALTALTTTTPIPGELRDAGVYGRERDVDADSGVADRLLAFTGRSPRPEPGGEPGP
jgi:uncharacterized protein (TIGR03086 family)